MYTVATEQNENYYGEHQKNCTFGLSVGSFILILFFQNTRTPLCGPTKVSCAIRYSFLLRTKVVIGCSEINWSVAGFGGGIET